MMSNKEINEVVEFEWKEEDWLHTLDGWLEEEYKKLNGTGIKEEMESIELIDSFIESYVSTMENALYSKQLEETEQYQKKLKTKHEKAGKKYFLNQRALERAIKKTCDKWEEKQLEKEIGHNNMESLLIRAEEICYEFAGKLFGYAQMSGTEEMFERTMVYIEKMKEMKEQLEKIKRWSDKEATGQWQRICYL